MKWRDEFGSCENHSTLRGGQTSSASKNDGYFVYKREILQHESGQNREKRIRSQDNTSGELVLP